MCGRVVYKLTRKDKLKLYDLLDTAYTVGQEVHLAVMGGFLKGHGETQQKYGFSKMLELFRALEGERLCSIIRKDMGGGIPPVYSIVLLPRPLFTDAELAEMEAEAAQMEAEPEETLEPEETQEEAAAGQADFDELPPDMERQHVAFPINCQNMVAKFIAGGQEIRITPEQLEQIKQDYCKAREEKKIVWDGAHNNYFFALSTPSADGKLITLSLARSTRESGPPWWIAYVGCGVMSSVEKDGARTYKKVKNKPGDALRQFAYLGSETDFLRSLAEHVQPEVWSFGGRPDDYTILNQYIKYTFYQLKREEAALDEEDRGRKICIAKDGSFAAFNTGLQSRRLGEDVFAYFVPNGVDNEIPWKFSCFCSSDSRDPGERRCYKSMVDEFQEPELATYFSNITDLLFDSNREVRLSSDHIFKDNCDRLPMDFLRRECYGFGEAEQLLQEIEAASETEKKALYSKLGDVITDDPDLFASMHGRLWDALRHTQKRIRRNYKLAVPCFFPTRNVMSMMLPLSFSATAAPSLVLVCERTRQGDYLGQTILTLPMAYIDARLLCRPGSEWLNTECIQSSEPVETDE